MATKRTTLLPALAVMSAVTAGLLLSSIPLLTTGCRGSSATAGERELADLRASIATYEKDPSEENGAAVEVAFSELDTAIVKLEAEVTTASAGSAALPRERADQLARERYELRNRYAKAIVAAKMNAAGEALKSLGAEVGRGLQAAGKSLEGAASDGEEKPAAE